MTPPAELPSREGVLAALVLDPASYSRNRFFELFRSPSMFLIRRRATFVRGLIRAFRTGSQEIVESIVSPPDHIVLRCSGSRVGLQRTVRLSLLEFALLCRQLPTVAMPTGSKLTPHVLQATVHNALSELAPPLPSPAQEAL